MTGKGSCEKWKGRIAWGQEYYRKHKPRILARQKLNPNRKINDKLSSNRKNAMARQKILEVLGGACIVCSFSDVRALQVDHVNGGGHHARRKLKQSTARQLLKAIVQSPNEFQLLCANCNWIKRCERREYRQCAA